MRLTSVEAAQRRLQSVRGKFCTTRAQHTCSACNTHVTTREIRRGWRSDPSDYSSECTQCHVRSVYYLRASYDGTGGADERVAWLGPEQIKHVFSFWRAQHAFQLDTDLLTLKLITDSPTLTWNLVHSFTTLDTGIHWLLSLGQVTTAATPLTFLPVHTYTLYEQRLVPGIAYLNDEEKSPSKSENQADSNPPAPHVDVYPQEKEKEQEQDDQETEKDDRKPPILHVPLYLAIAAAAAASAKSESPSHAHKEARVGDKRPREDEDDNEDAADETESDVEPEASSPVVTKFKLKVKVRLPAGPGVKLMKEPIDTHGDAFVGQHWHELRDHIATCLQVAPAQIQDRRFRYVICHHSRFKLTHTVPRGHLARKPIASSPVVATKD
jgi:hypothetical protein